MIDVIIDIIRSLNAGNVLPFQKDAETKIDLYNKDVELYTDYSGNEKKYYYFAELKMDDEKDDNLPQIEDILRNNEVFAAIGEPNPSDSYMILLWQIENIDESIYPYVIKIEENEFFPKAVMNDFDKMVLLSQQKEQNQPADADKVLAQMTKARRTFIDQYNHAVEMGKFNPNKCPLYREL